MTQFTEEELSQYAFPAVIESGQRVFRRGKVSNLLFIGIDIIATVTDERTNRVVLTRQSEKKLHFDCTCGFTYGGACEHIIAAMLAVNAHNAIQVSIDWDNLSTSPPESELLHPSLLAVNEVSSRPIETHIENKPFEEVSSDDENDSAAVVEVATEKPQKRIYLAEHDSKLMVELRFAYFNGTVEFARQDTSSSRLVPNLDGNVYRVNRSRARETLITSSLTNYELMQYQTGTFTPTIDPRVWILQALPRLADDGFEIYGQEKLKASNARKSTPKLSVAVSSKEGVFDCNVAVSVDGISSTLAALIHAVRQGSRFILLTDGSSGMLPQVWLEKFASLFAVIDADPQNKSLSIKMSHIALIDMLSDMADNFEGDQDFDNKREALRGFKGIDKPPFPENFDCTMRPYQVAGYEWFYFLKRYRFGGCLADDMGLGKTVQTIALLLMEKQLAEHQPSIVVVPTSLLFNWQREAKKFAPALNFLIYHGPGRHRYDHVLHMSDVVLTSYGTILRDIENLKSKHFHYLILDEAQAIKNPGSQVSRAVKQLFANHKLALSGTPIENNLSELWSMFSFLNPGMLGSYRHFAVNFVKPIERECNETAAEVLRKLLFPFVLRRTKEQVAKDLPPKNEIIMYADMLPRQKIIYDITRDTYRGKIINSLDKEGINGSRFQILEGLLRLRQICCHPRMVDPNFVGDSGKFRLLDEAMEDIVSEGHRVLVFSQFVKALELLRSRLAEKGIRSEILTGQTRDRQAVVDRFQNQNSAPVFLISLKAGGTGLNLTAADYVIHIDPWWNPSAENQASDRAYRIGQTRPVFVYKVITKDSIEERVLALQQQKQQLVNAVIQCEASFFKGLSHDDVVHLFS